MIKIIRDLDITDSGVCVYNRKPQAVHLQQGDMDGACAVYSMMMNLIALKVFTRNQIINLNTSFKGNKYCQRKAFQGVFCNGRIMPGWI